MSRLQAAPLSHDVVEQLDLQKAVERLVTLSNAKVSRQPEEVSRAMSSYLEPDESNSKPWETWL